MRKTSEKKYPRKNKQHTIYLSPKLTAALRAKAKAREITFCQLIRNELAHVLIEGY